MEKFIVKGGKKLIGEVKVSGAKNAALKALVAACLTTEELTIKNVPLISDLFIMLEIIKEIGGKVHIMDHEVRVSFPSIRTSKISLDKAATIRTSIMFLAPLLIRCRKATIPNPGGCRIGARPIDRIIDGLKVMGAQIKYNRNDGYFLATTNGMKGVHYRFEKNTHMGTETLLLASVCATGKTVLENVAQEPEVDELISLLGQMGADIKREDPRTIVINGVEKLHGTSFTIGPDRNEAVTFGIAAFVTDGNIVVKGICRPDIQEFLEKVKVIGGMYKEEKDGIRFYKRGELRSIDVVTSPYPGFMTDWQAPWAVLMTKAHGTSTIHETVYENRFGYVGQLRKMGARIQLFNPPIDNPEKFYNFNKEDDKKEYYHAARILGPLHLHNAVVNITDLRAGATLVLAALGATGQSILFGVEHLDRGYEKFDIRLRSLGADIKRVHSEYE